MPAPHSLHWNTNKILLVTFSIAKCILLMLHKLSLSVQLAATNSMFPGLKWCVMKALKLCWYSYKFHFYANMAETLILYPAFACNIAGFSWKWLQHVRWLYGLELQSLLQIMYEEVKSITRTLCGKEANIGVIYTTCLLTESIKMGNQGQCSHKSPHYIYKLPIWSIKI